MRLLLSTVALVSLVGAVPALGQSFTRSELVGQTSNKITSLQFGPDGRLYVSSQDGTIRIYTVQQNAPNDYQVTATEVLTHIKDIPNHNDDGTLEPGETSRLCTGILVTGTAQNPVIYASSSDPRIAIGVDTGLDTNSGTISRLTWNGSTWDKLDLVRGLSRCEENHATNGMQLDEATNTLYVSQGGMTNMGAPSNNFGITPEYALSGAVLTIDLDAIGNTTYDIPTLDDPSRPNTGPGGSDENDPFGGNDGDNMAMVVPGGPVQLFATGLRNQYDLCFTENGNIYTIDNGPNSGWGGPPVSCHYNQQNEAGSKTYPDNLHLIGTVGGTPGYYAGTPNPIRGSLANTVNGQNAVPTENPIECLYLIPGVEDGALWTWNASVNGLDEYTATNFSGALQGSLIACSWNDSSVQLIELNSAGDQVTNVSTLFSNVGANTLDVTCQGDADPFPGTIWVCTLTDKKIFIFEPQDAFTCNGTNDPLLDEDSDGFDNADEILNGTDPCSAADVPADFDGDFESDLIDPDDDNDGILDENDAFARDRFNGLTTRIPLSYGWALGAPGHGLLGLGWTGLMTNGTDTYLDQFDPNDLTAGGAAGKFSIDTTPPGTAQGATNTQQNGFQLGVAVDQNTGPYVVRTRVAAPIFNATPADDQAVGLYIGTGDQDNYVRVSVVANAGAGGLEVATEDAGTYSSVVFPAAGVLTATDIDLELEVNPANGTVQARYSIDGAQLSDLGSPVTLTGATLTAVQGPDALAVGVISTSVNATPFVSTWDFIEVLPLASTAAALVSIDPPGDSIDGTTFLNDAFEIRNDSTGGEQITRVEIDLGAAAIPDFVFDPDGTAGDVGGKQFTLNTNNGVDTVNHTFDGSFHNGLNSDDGYDRLVIDFTGFDPGDSMFFSIDNDPTSIKGGTPPGANDAGSVSGTEFEGARVTVDFDDGTRLVSEIHRTAGTQNAGHADLATATPPAPIIECLAGSTPTTTIDPNQTFRVHGTRGDTVKVLRTEGGLFTDPASPFPAGYDVDPFEVSSIVVIDEQTQTIGPDGYVDVNFTLSRFAGDGSYTLNANDDPGVNHIVAVVEEAGGRTGYVSDPQVIQLVTTDLNPTIGTLDFGTIAVGDSPIDTVTFQNTGSSSLQVTDIDVTGIPTFLISSAPSTPFALAPAATFDVDVQFAPESGGTFNGSIDVTHDGNNSPVGVALTGSAIESVGTILYRVNCGGPELTTLDTGPNWEGDPGDGTTSPYRNAGPDIRVGTSNSSIFDATMPPSTPVGLIQSERFDNDGTNGGINWLFPVASGTQVHVRLYFCNGWSGTSEPGERLFNVDVEGVNVLNEFDITAEVGHKVGTMREYTVTSDGFINIDIYHGSIQNPLINGIEILVAEGGNQPPQAIDDNATVDQFESVDIDVLANDMDDTGIDATTVAVTTPAAEGNTSVNPTTGVVTYTHNGSVATSDSFQYTVMDIDAQVSNTATVNVTITPNQAPDAQGDPNIYVQRGNQVIVDVLANDTDPDGTIDPTTVQVASPPANGNTSVNPTTGAITYTHDGSGTIFDALTYTVDDDDGATSTPASVTFIVTTTGNPNVDPVANDDNDTVVEGQSVEIDVVANDSDSDGSLEPSSVLVDQQPAEGTTSVNVTTGAITYTHTGALVANDTFTYTIMDNDGGTSNAATVTITIQPANAAPTAGDDSGFVVRNDEILIDLLANDSDPDGTIDPASVAIIDPPDHANLSVSMTTGVATYTHNGTGGSSDSFTYTVDDDMGGTSNVATVTITVGEFGDLVPTNLVLHLESDSGITEAAGAVSAWADQSVHANDVTGAGTLLEDELNGLPAVQFDGLADRLDNAAPNALPSGDSERTVFLLTRYAADGAGVAWGVAPTNCPADGNQMFALAHAGDASIDAGCPANLFMSGTAPVGWVVQSARTQSGAFEHYIDGSLVDNLAHAFATGAGPLVVGGNLDGVGTATSIGAVLIYDRALTEFERQSVEQYLSDKYLDPIQPNQLALRLESDQGVLTNGADVTDWLDQSPNQNDVSAQGAPTLSTGVANGLDAVTFDGVDDMLSRIAPTGLPSADSDRSMFVVARYRAAGPGGVAYGTPAVTCPADGNQAFGLELDAAGELTVEGACAANSFPSGVSGIGAGWIVQSVVHQSSGFVHYLDGAMIDASAHAFNTVNGAIAIGGTLDGLSSVDMDVAAVLIYDGALTEGQRESVECYLQNKYLGASCGPTPCVADTTTTGAGAGDPGFGVPDGQVTGADLSYFVNLWSNLDPAADLTTVGAGPGDPNYGVPDGQVTTPDLNFFVNAWVLGCP